ncbi:MAG: DUF853 family protein [Thermoplasmata archaeon]|nr:DUF853 family protein [Thermoplasmata archaeon]
MCRSGLHDAPLLVPGLPPELPFGFLGRALPTSGFLEMRLQLHRVPGDRALELLGRAGAVAMAEMEGRSDAPGARPSQFALELESSQELARRVAGREQELYRVGISFHGRGTAGGRAEKLRRELAHRLELLGFRTRMPTYEAKASVDAPDLAGTERRPVGYWHTLHTDGVAAFFPFVDETVAEAGGVLLGLLLDDASPVLLDRWSHSSHSWGLFGSTGSGKTFAATLWTMRTLWQRPETEVMIVDPLGEFAGWARGLGGTALELAGGSAGRLNPLDPVTTGGDRQEKAGRVGTQLRALFPSLLDEEAAVLDACVNRLFDNEHELPTFSSLLEEVERSKGRAGRLPELLEVFRSGSLRHLDGPTNVVWGASPLVISLKGLPEAHLPFHLTYVLDALYGRLRSGDHPKLLVIDEAHLLARHAPTAEFLDRIVRHVRHFGAGVLLLSQNPDDFLSTESGRSLLRNLRATVLLRLSEVSEATRSFFALTSAESEWLPRARLPKEAGYSEALLRLGPSHLPIAVIASTPEYDLLRGLLLTPEAAGDQVS